MQLVILLGGKATRLGYLAVEKPKCLQLIHNQPFLDIILNEYRNAGFTKFVLLAGHLGEQLKRYESDNIKVIVEKEPMGTGGAIIDAMKHLNKHFFVCNGDTFIAAKDVAKFVEYAKEKDASLVMGTHSGLYAFNKQTLVNWNCRDRCIPSNVSNEELLEKLHGHYNLEKDIISNIKWFHYCVNTNKFHDIGTPESLESFRAFYKRKAIFLDRDGTIMEHVPYIKDPKDVKLIPNTIFHMKKAKEMGYLLIMISNQAGPAKGVQTQEQFERVHARMISLLKKEGIVFDDQFICCSADNNHPRRKPNTGMVEEAIDKWNLDREQCVFVGDRPSIDIECGKRAHIPRLYLTEDFRI
jgi:D-glycero-D-manno-heptose 1,7-bisphosphate phosphatase